MDHQSLPTKHHSIFYINNGTYYDNLESHSSENETATSPTHDTILGCVIVLLVAFLWACGDICYRLINLHCFNNQNKQYISKWTLTCFFNSAIGFLMLTFWWCIFIDQPILIPNLYQIIWIGILSSLMLLANLMQFLSVIMTSPFFLNIAMFGKIPLSFVADIFIHHYEITWLSICGSLLIIISFLMLEVVDPPISWRLCRKAIIGEELSMNDNKKNSQNLILEKNLNHDNTNDNLNININTNHNDINIQKNGTKINNPKNKEGSLYYLLDKENKDSRGESLANMGDAKSTLSSDESIHDVTI